jgi:hypothetical protein
MTLSRKHEGQPLRDAMRAAGMSGPKLAAATKTVDPTGRGISPAIVGRLTGQGKTAREKCRGRTAGLISAALLLPVEVLFDMPSDSTSTVERSRPNAHEG